jgi:hypothetical protein
MPIACSLAGSDAQLQMDEWRELLQSTVTSVERVSPTSLSLGLGDRPRLTAVIDLAQRELACCPFLEFSIKLRSGGITLQIASPAEASPILDRFAALAS